MDARSLSAAIKDGDAEAVRAALAEGVGVNARNGGGLTPLMQAAFHGHVQITRLLLEGGANPDYEDISGLTASDWALRRGHTEVVRLLQMASSAAARPPVREDHPRQFAEAGSAPIGTVHTPDQVPTRTAHTSAAASKRTRQITPHAADHASINTADHDASHDAGHDSSRDSSRDAAPGAEEVARLTRELQEAQQVAAEERRRAEEEAAGRRAEEQGRMRAEEKTARLTRDFEGARQLAEERGRRLAEAEAARELAEEEARRTAADAARLAREYEDVRRLAETQARAHAEVTAAQTFAPELARTPEKARSRPEPPKFGALSQGNRLVMLTVLAGLVGGGLIGVYIVNRFTAPAAVEVPQPAQAAPAPAAERVKVYGLLSGRQVTLPEAIYPEEALRGNVSGVVTVQVGVNNKGEVLTASAVDGHPKLHQAAVQAARQAKFSTQGLPTKAGRLSGTITYNFVPPGKQ